MNACWSKDWRRNLYNGLLPHDNGKVSKILQNFGKCSSPSNQYIVHSHHCLIAWNYKSTSQVSLCLYPESYENDEILQTYEEAVEEGKDASNVTIDDFELLKLIGKGGYSQVFMARKKDSGQLYAIKVMDKKHLLSCMTPSAIVREVQINRKC